MERALFAAYPTVTVINIADVLDRIESVVDQITFVVRFLAGFSILAGLMILASSIASARFRRIVREAVVPMKTTWVQPGCAIMRTFSVEFSVLGLLAGSVGVVVFANILTRVLLPQTGSQLSHRLVRDSYSAGGNGDPSQSRYRMDRELPNSRPSSA